MPSLAHTSASCRERNVLPLSTYKRNGNPLRTIPCLNTGRNAAAASEKVNAA